MEITEDVSIEGYLDLTQIDVGKIVLGVLYRSVVDENVQSSQRAGAFTYCSGSKVGIPHVSLKQ